MSDNVQTQAELQEVVDEAWRKFDAALAEAASVREQISVALEKLLARNSEPAQATVTRDSQHEEQFLAARRQVGDRFGAAFSSGDVEIDLDSQESYLRSLEERE